MIHAGNVMTSVVARSSSAHWRAPRACRHGAAAPECRDPLHDQDRLRTFGIDCGRIERQQAPEHGVSACFRICGGTVPSPLPVITASGSSSGARFSPPLRLRHLQQRRAMTLLLEDQLRAGASRCGDEHQAAIVSRVPRRASPRRRPRRVRPPRCAWRRRPYACASHLTAAQRRPRSRAAWRSPCGRRSVPRRACRSAGRRSPRRRARRRAARRSGMPATSASRSTAPDPPTSTIAGC